MCNERRYIFDFHDCIQSNCQSKNGIVYFDQVPRATMLKAINTLPAEILDERYNEIPTMRELINMEDARMYGGYLISPPRNDAKIVIDCLYIPIGADRDILYKLQETAQEWRLISDQKLWYFRWI